MMQSSSYLQTPKTGRSRFSKALPPRPLETMSSRTMTPVIVPSSSMSPLSPASRAKDLPALPPQAPADDEASSKVTSPQLPPLPFMKPLTPIGLPATPKAPPPMAIPRRPVGKPTMAPAEPSPTGSLSSLLSAYSRSSGESLIRYSDGGTSSKGESEPTLSPTHDDMEGKFGDMSPPMSIAAFNDKEKELPRLESGHVERPVPVETRTDSPTLKSSQPDQSSKDVGQGYEQTASPTSPQIWRRRSLKSSQNLEVTSLKLDTNYNSKADSRSLNASAASQTPIAQNSPARPLQPPFVYGLPGKDIRPAATKNRILQAAKEENPQDGQPQLQQQSPTQPQVPPKRPNEAPAMGSKISMLKEKFQKRREENSPQQTHFPPRSASRKLPPVVKSPASSNNRPPTPEYTKHEVEVPVADRIVSPVSPAASPELPKYEQPSEAAPRAAPPGRATYAANEPAQQELQPVARKPVSERDLHAVRSLPKMHPPAVSQTNGEKPPPVSNEYATPGVQDAETREEQQGAAPAREQQFEQTPRFPPRTTSIRHPGGRQPNLNTSVSMQEMRPSSRSRGQYQAYQAGMPVDEGSQFGKRSDQTIYRETNQDDLPPPDPRAAYFPLKNDQGEPINPPMSPSTVFKAPKLTTAHYECFARHSQMVVSRNKAYSLSCQACNVEDSEMRWQCSWCRLRICGRCVRALQKLDKDLSKLLDYVEKNPPGSGLSSRPSTSSGGLGKVEEAPEAEAPPLREMITIQLQ